MPSYGFASYERVAVSALAGFERFEDTDSAASNLQQVFQNLRRSGIQRSTLHLRDAEILIIL